MERLSKTITQNYGDKILMVFEILNCVTKFTEKALADLNGIMEYLGKKKLQVKLLNNAHCDSLLSCSRDIFTKVTMKNPKFQELIQGHKNRLEAVIQFLHHTKSFDETSFLINLASDRTKISKSKLDRLFSSSSAISRQIASPRVKTILLTL